MKTETRTLRVLASAQVLTGLGVAGTVAAGSLLVASITDSETLAGLAQTSSVLGAAALALPLARLTQRGGRRRCKGLQDVGINAKRIKRRTSCDLKSFWC